MLGNLLLGFRGSEDELTSLGFPLLTHPVKTFLGVSVKGLQNGGRDLFLKLLSLLVNRS